MIEGLLLDRVDAEAARAAVGEELDAALVVAAHEAKTTLSLTQFAGTGTHVALDALVIHPMPVARIDR
jgi:hypothetical protein